MKSRRLTRVRRPVAPTRSRSFVNLAPRRSLGVVRYPSTTLSCPECSSRTGRATRGAASTSTSRATSSTLRRSVDLSIRLPCIVSTTCTFTSMTIRDGELRFPRGRCSRRWVRYVATLFPDSPVHVGGDECPTVEWSESAAARAVMAEHAFVDVAQLQGLFTTRLTAMLHADGHEVIAWDEAVDAGVAEGLVIAAWRSSSKAVQAAQSGLDVIM